MYCTPDDIKRKIGATAAKELVLFSGEPALTDEEVNIRISEYITEQSELMDSYLRGHYNLPMPESASTVLRQICVKLVITELYTKRGIPDEFKDMVRQATEILRDLQSGKIQLQETLHRGSPIGIAVTSPSKIFTDDVLSRM